MLIASIIIFFVVLIAVVYVFLTMPRVVDSADMDLLCTDYAHRGLHSNQVAENSLTAFELAKNAGYGIELDVQMSSDGKIFVFHDDNLKRMCGIDKKLTDTSSDELSSLILANSQEHIPLFTDVLKLVDGRVPLLIEIKHTPNEKELCQQLCVILDTYQGAFAVQSFNPQILSYFKKYRPRFARGQLVTRLGKKQRKEKAAPKNPIICFALTHMLTNVLSRPDFISIDGKMLGEPAFLLATKVFRSKAFVWTVRKDEQYSVCRKKQLYAIFEYIHP